MTAGDKSKVYGSADPALTTTDRGSWPPISAPARSAFSASRAAGESVAGGPYTITPAASDGATSLLGNYDVTSTPGTADDHQEGGVGDRGGQVEGVRVG